MSIHRWIDKEGMIHTHTHTHTHRGKILSPENEWNSGPRKYYVQWHVRHKITIMLSLIHGIYKIKATNMYNRKIQIGKSEKSEVGMWKI